MKDDQVAGQTRKTSPGAIPIPFINRQPIPPRPNYTKTTINATVQTPENRTDGIEYIFKWWDINWFCLTYFNGLFIGGNFRFLQEPSANTPVW